jgi:hypothetical protein
MMQPGFIFSLIVLAVATVGARGAGPERSPLAVRAAMKAQSPDLLASFEAARETDLTVEALARLEPAWEQAGREQVAKLPKLAMVRRRSHGLRGTNGTMFAQRTDRGSAILVWDPARLEEPPKVILDTADGFVWDISPSWDGRKLVFSYKEKNDEPFHVWEVNTDGTDLRQITRGPYHDFNPVYYPDGRIVFCSSRVEAYSLCQDFLAAALYLCDGDGGNLRRIDFTSLCTSAPAVLPDGTILCTRWEYQDKNIFSWQGLWSIHPDGRQLKLFFGNTFTIPNSRYGGKPVPGTDDVLITMAAHHQPPISDIALVDRNHGMENVAGMRKVTFETPLEITRGRDWRDTNWGPGDQFYSQAACDPWPIRDGLFLAAIGNDARPAAGFRICLCRYDGTRYPVFARAGESFFSPVTLVPRALPRTIITGQAPQTAGEGTFFVQDVYQGLLEQGVQRGHVKALRVVRQLPKKWNTEGPRFHDHYPVIGYGSYYVKENIGEAPVDSNGSAYFSAPSNCELYFIALDKDGKEIQRMGSVTQITTGEHVSCVGCHDDRMKAPPPAMPQAARLSRPPDQLRLPPWGAGPFDYIKHVQPVWDRYCVSCHAGRAPAAGVDLSGDKTRFFNMSYDYLVERNMVAYYFINPGPTGVFPAMQSGSQVSRLTKLIETQHHKVKLDDDSRRRVYAWIDSNIQYYGTWDMSRPHTMGGRDPWHFVPDNQRVAPQPEPWFAELKKTYTPQCGACHPPLDGEGNHNRWINLTRPEFSRLLNAHLARQAGGLELAGKKNDQTARIFPDRKDPVYQALWQAIEKGKAALLARPRMDMPGAVAIPQERNFGKVF